MLRDLHLQCIAGHGRMNWRRRSGYKSRARAEAAISRWKQVIEDHLGARFLALRRRSRTSRRQLSADSGVSPTSIAEAEAGRLGHFVVVERVGEALGPGWP